MSAIVRASSLDLGSFPESVAIASGQTTSGAWKVSQWASGGFTIPATFTGSSVSFLVACDAGGKNNLPGTFEPLYDKSGALETVTVSANRSFAFPADVFCFDQVQIVSNASETPGRTILVFGKG